eukprot:gene26094-49946_t
MPPSADDCGGTELVPAGRSIEYAGGYARVDPDDGSAAGSAGADAVRSPDGRPRPEVKPQRCGRVHYALAAFAVAAVAVAAAVSVLLRSPPTTPGTAPSDAVAALAADVTAAMDPTADPCTDFYTYACGGWVRGHPIPPERTAANRWVEMEDRSRAALRAALEGADSGDIAARLYRSCTDTAGGDAAGHGALLPLLQAVDDGLPGPDDRPLTPSAWGSASAMMGTLFRGGVA